MSNKKITVLVADDHPLVRKGLIMVLKTLGIKKILEADNGKQALDICENNAIDLFLLDFRMPGKDGFDVAKLLLQKDKTKRIIIISMYHDGALILNLFKAGVKGFLMKNSDIDEIELAIKTVLKDKVYYHKSFEPLLGHELSKLPGTKIPPLKFNKAELEIMQSLSLGYTSKEISSKLNLTAKTIETYRSRLLEKVGVSNTSELLNYFHQNGLL